MRGTSHLVGKVRECGLNKNQCEMGMFHEKCCDFWQFCAGSPLKLYFQIPCVFPVRPQIFPVPIYIICECYIYRTDLAGLFSFWKKRIFLRQLSQYPLLLESEHLQLELTKFPVFRQNFVFSLCFDKISKFPVFSLTGIFFWPFSVFPVPWVPCLLMFHNFSMTILIFQSLWEPF